MRVAMVTTHPIQYQVPWLRLLGQKPGIDLHVFFAMVPDASEQGREFGVAFDWDVPLLGGYDHSVLQNVSKRPSLTEFAGCDTPGIGKALRDGRFDAVIVNGWGSKTCLQALWACRRAGVPCIVRGEVNGLRHRAGWKRLGHRMLLSRYAAVLTIGANNRTYCIQQGVDAAKLFNTPYCVDNQRFAAMADAARADPGRELVAQRFGMNSQATTFLFSGKLVEKKRPGDLIEALRLARQQGADGIQLLLVGDGPLRAELEKQARELPVHFAGFLNQSEIGAAYAASDCLLLPSDAGETWGLVVNEAMASGLPAIVSDQVGCAANLIQPGVTGEVFPCTNVEALAALLVSHAGQRPALATMGENARRQVLEGYNFDRVVDGVMAALERVTEIPR